jgi:hypothetical protein
MKMAYSDDREWSDRFIPAIRQIVGPHLLLPAPMELDRKEATDLIVFTARDMRIAARVRRPVWRQHHEREFTMRSRVKSGADTELHKIIEGWGDWMFYGFAKTEEPPSIFPWFIVDLNAFRRHYSERSENGLRFESKSTQDSKEFLAFDIDSFPATPPLLIASSNGTPAARAQAAG